MRILQINLDYKNKPDEKTGALQDPRELTENYINFAIHQKYPQGIDGQLKSVVGRIHRKLSEARDEKADSIELEEAEYDLIRRAMELAKFPAAVCEYVMILEEALQNTKIKEEEE